MHRGRAQEWHKGAFLLIAQMDAEDGKVARILENMMTGEDFACTFIYYVADKLGELGVIGAYLCSGGRLRIFGVWFVGAQNEGRSCVCLTCCTQVRQGNREYWGLRGLTSVC